MNKKKRVCSHYWIPEWDELKCYYCGRRLYRNPDPGGPRWIPAFVPVGADLDLYHPDRRKRGSRRKSESKTES